MSGLYASLIQWAAEMTEYSHIYEPQQKPHIHYL